MASVNNRDFDTAEKASSLVVRETADTAESGKRSRTRVFGDDTVGSTATRRKGTVWVDLILLFVLVAVIVGGVLGYRAVKRAYSPVWEERRVVFVVEFPRIDAEILPEYWHVDAPMYTSDKVDDTPLGYLMENPCVTATDVIDGRTYKSLRLVMHSTVRYREGQGYYCGDTPILAGLSGTLRVDGVSGNGVITAVYEAAEYAALEPAGS